VERAIVHEKTYDNDIGLLIMSTTIEKGINAKAIKIEFRI
jgi:hypothetical protein